MSLRRVLILDTETTGLDPKKDRCIEVACILYDLVHAVPICSCAYLIAGHDNAAEAINRIPAAVLREIGWMPSVWGEVQWMAVEGADVILAHRAEFDRSFVPKEIQDAKPWVCTKFHVDWPMGKPGDSLVPLALAHGVGVVSAHRAMTDCDILARLLTRVHEMGQSLPKLIERAMRPRVKVAARVSYDDRDQAKAHGFAWHPETKQWIRDMPIDDIGALPFQTRPVST